jgi:ankyrin repeat protein
MRAGTEEHRAFMRPKFPECFELFYAVLEGTGDDVVRRLALGDNPNAMSIDGSTPIFYARENYLDRDLNKMDALYKAGARIDIWDHYGRHPLHWRVGFFDYRDTLWLLEHNVDPNVPVRASQKYQFEPVGWTALHMAVNNSLLPIVNLLLEHKADANGKSEDGSTPLHIAARQRVVYKRLIRTLIDGGADVNAITLEGQTPLHELVARRGKYSMAAVRFLLYRGARLDIWDVAGHLPIDLITESIPEDWLKTLLQKHGERKA